MGLLTELAPDGIESLLAGGVGVVSPWPLTEPEVYALLGAAGIDSPRHRLVAHPGAVDDALCAALDAAEAVVKVVAPEIVHKSDVGGVVHCPNDPASVRRAVEQVLEAGGDRPSKQALICERVRFRSGLGLELLAAIRHDPAFGPVVVLGAGGLDAEALIEALRPERARVVLAAAGLEAATARDALRRTLVGAALSGRLRGSRGQADREEEAVALLLALARLAEERAGFVVPGGAGLLELELNPVVTADDGRVVALDGFARLHRPKALPPGRRVAALRSLLAPESAVVVGASSRGANVGRVILRNLLEAGGIHPERLWALHPRALEIDGCRCYREAAQLPERPDLAVVALPADRDAERTVIEIVEGRHTRSVLLVSAGFAETHAGGGAERRLRAAIEASHRDPDGGVLVNGGNCLGLLSRPGRHNSFFIPSYKVSLGDAPARNAALISQSGAWLVAQMSSLEDAVAPRHAISLGNQIDVTVSDYLEYLGDDEEIAVFAIYLEGFRSGDGARFLKLVREITGSGRAVLLYKAGRTAAGSAAIASHTAAAVGDHDVCGELVRAAGAVTCSTLSQLEDLVMTFSLLAERRRPIRRVAVLSNAGFECAAAADHLHGVELAGLTRATRERLRELIPSVVDIHNPVDTTPTASTECYAACAEALLDDPEVDAVVVAGVPVSPALESLPPGPEHAEDVWRATSLPSRLIRSYRRTTKPMVFSLDAGPRYGECARLMRAAGLPVFPKVHRATRALATFATRRS